MPHLQGLAFYSHICWSWLAIPMFARPGPPCKYLLELALHSHICWTWPCIPIFAGPGPTFPSLLHALIASLPFLLQFSVDCVHLCAGMQLFSMRGNAHHGNLQQKKCLLNSSRSPTKKYILRASGNIVSAMEFSWDYARPRPEECGQTRQY